MQKRTILITGGASGIGLGIAKYLGGKGHKIIIADINLLAAEEAATKLQQQNVDAQAISLDVTNVAQIEKFT